MHDFKNQTEKNENTSNPENQIKLSTMFSMAKGNKIQYEGERS